MKNLPRYLSVIAIGLVVFVISRYTFPQAPETAQLFCSFTAKEQTAQLTIPFSQGGVISRVDFEAELTGKFVHEDAILWHADGIANFPGGSQHIAGAVFLSPTNKVRALGLYRDRHPHQADDLHISTLNENGKIDWDEHSAFVYFEGATGKTAHAFEYHCAVTY